MTNAERMLWAHLRREQLGVKFRRQHPLGRFIVDFHAPAVNLAIELDGGQHALREAEDASRTAWLAARGVNVLRFWNNEILQNCEGVLLAIQAVIASLSPSTSLSTPTLALPLAGGGNANINFSALRLTRAAPEQD